MGKLREYISNKAENYAEHEVEVQGERKRQKCEGREQRQTDVKVKRLVNAKKEVLVGLNSVQKLLTKAQQEETVNVFILNDFE